MSIFGMVIVLAFQICILLMGFTASFSSGPQLYESWHEFPIDLLNKDVSSLDTKWRHGQKFEDPPCPNSQYIGTLSNSDSPRPLRQLQTSHYKILLSLMMGIFPNIIQSTPNMSVLKCIATCHGYPHIILCMKIAVFTFSSVGTICFWKGK